VAEDATDEECSTGGLDLIGHRRPPFRESLDDPLIADRPARNHRHGADDAIAAMCLTFPTMLDFRHKTFEEAVTRYKVILR
jgi:hypothetical protein